jgi:hypothetical protein
VGRTDRQTDRMKESRRLHLSSVPLYNILQACPLFQHRLSNISCAWHSASPSMAQRTLTAQCQVQSSFKTPCHDGRGGVKETIHTFLILILESVEPSASRSSRFLHYSLGRKLGEIWKKRQPSVVIHFLLKLHFQSQ